MPNILYECDIKNLSIQQTFNECLLGVLILKEILKERRLRTNYQRTQISNFKLIYSLDNVTKKHLIIHTQSSSCTDTSNYHN